jgi:hypothetical protein
MGLYSSAVQLACNKTCIAWCYASGGTQPCYAVGYILSSQHCCNCHLETPPPTKIKFRTAPVLYGIDLAGGKLDTSLGIEPLRELLRWVGTLSEIALGAVCPPAAAVLLIMATKTQELGY